MLTLKVRLVHSEAQLPKRMTGGSVGFDLYAAESVTIPGALAREGGGVNIGRALIPIGIEIELPEGTVGRIASRSGLSINYNIEVGAGWVDNDYRGPIFVELKNLGSIPYKVNVRDRVAQLIILSVAVRDAELVTEIEKTERGPSGFGSTGL